MAESDKVRYAMDTDDKNVREDRLNEIRSEIIEVFGGTTKR